MNTFYSILYVPLKQEAQERLSIGLFMRNNEQVFFEYSKFKLSLVKELLTKSAFDLLNLNLRNIKRTAHQDFSEKNGHQTSLCQESVLNEPSLQDAYFGYLSRYSNNLLGFTAPSQIDVNLDSKTFKVLFAKLVDERHFLETSEQVAVDVVQRTRSVLRPLIKTRVNWDFEITRKHVPQLILPSVHMDFAGKNEIIVTGQAVDFEKRSYFLENDIAKQVVLLDAMKQANEQSTSFVLGKEPNKKEHPKNHHIWKNICQEQRISFVDADEYEKVTVYMEKHDVKPLELSE